VIADCQMPIANFFPLGITKIGNWQLAIGNVRIGNWQLAI